MEQARPNIVFLLLDNVGWGNFGCYGSMIPTPRIDKFASEGIRFNNYNVECQCTPTRSAIMLGKSDTSGRDSYMFFGPDGELMSIKWKIYKVIFRYTENEVYRAIQSGFITPQFPMFYDLTSDPHEDNNLFNSDLTCAWMVAPVFKIVAEYEHSVKEYPNIKVGEDFKGYKK